LLISSSCRPFQWPWSGYFTPCPTRSSRAASPRKAVFTASHRLRTPRDTRAVLAGVHNLCAREPECYTDYRRSNGAVSAPGPFLSPCHCRNRPTNRRDATANRCDGVTVCFITRHSRSHETLCGYGQTSFCGGLLDPKASTERDTASA
jgi:hypothetical protein